MSWLAEAAAAVCCGGSLTVAGVMLVLLANKKN